MERDTPILVAGAGGFIGGALVARLVADGHTNVTGADIKPLGDWWQTPPGMRTACSKRDLRERAACESLLGGRPAVIFNLACNMGGMGFIESHQADCAANVLINTHLLMSAQPGTKYFFASTACVYRAALQTGHARPLREQDAHPAEPEGGYGWEKLYGEQMCRHFHEDYGIDTRVARFHTIYGPHGTWTGGREKVPAALCRKVAEGQDPIEVWGDGQQERSMLYVEDAVDAILRLVETDYHEPVNIGATEIHTVNELLDTVERVAGRSPAARRYDATQPQGVRGRSSDNALMHSLTGWEPTTSLEDGIASTYPWVAEQVAACRSRSSSLSATV